MKHLAIALMDIYTMHCGVYLLKNNFSTLGGSVLGLSFLVFVLVALDRKDP